MLFGRIALAQKQHARDLMYKCVFNLLLALLIVTSTPSHAGEKITECDKYAKESEFSWNPDNQFVTPRLSRFYNLQDEITNAYANHNFGKVKELAKENFGLAAVYRCNWNYGNAIHDTNRVLGLVSLQAGDIDMAVDYLLKAGKSTGSPQLNSFGPELDLANELLQLGKCKEVKTYLMDIKLFWKMDNGQIDRWLGEIDKGRKPELDRFAFGKPSPVLVALWNVAILLPLIASIGIVYVQRKLIVRKVPFFVIAVLSGYAVIYAVGWIMDKAMLAMLSNQSGLSITVINLIGYLYIGILSLLVVLTIFLLARFFRSNFSK